MLTIEQAKNLLKGTLIRLRPQASLAARPGATAEVRLFENPYLYVEWIRNGLDKWQINGAYDPQDFELVKEFRNNDYVKVSIPTTISDEYCKFSIGWIEWINTLDEKVVILDERYDRKAGVGHYDTGWMVKFDEKCKRNSIFGSPPSNQIRPWLPVGWLSPHKFDFVGLCDFCGGINKHETECSENNS